MIAQCWGLGLANPENEPELGLSPLPEEEPELGRRPRPRG